MSFWYFTAPTQQETSKAGVGAPNSRFDMAASCFFSLFPHNFYSSFLFFCTFSSSFYTSILSHFYLVFQAWLFLVHGIFCLAVQVCLVLFSFHCPNHVQLGQRVVIVQWVSDLDSVPPAPVDSQLPCCSGGVGFTSQKKSGSFVSPCSRTSTRPP